MANQTKAETAAALQAAGIPPKAFSIPQFCARHALSKVLSENARAWPRSARNPHS